MEFCPDCGRKLKEVPEAAFDSVQPASRGRRFGGWFVDSLIVWLLAMLSLVPVLGQEVAAVSMVLFWLFRDINGKSPGKALVGTVIVSRSGSPATTRQRIVRNLPFAVSILPLFIPIIGYVDFPLQWCVYILEAIMVLVSCERLGDKMAGTMVIKRPSVPISYQERLGAEL